MISLNKRTPKFKRNREELCVIRGNCSLLFLFQEYEHTLLSSAGIDSLQKGHKLFTFLLRWPPQYYLLFDTTVFDQAMTAGQYTFQHLARSWGAACMRLFKGRQHGKGNRSLCQGELRFPMRSSAGHKDSSEVHPNAVGGMAVPVSPAPTATSNAAEPHIAEAMSYLWGPPKEPKHFPCKEQKYSVISGNFS